MLLNNEICGSRAENPHSKPAFHKKNVFYSRVKFKHGIQNSLSFQVIVFLLTFARSLCGFCGSSFNINVWIYYSKYKPKVNWKRIRRFQSKCKNISHQTHLETKMESVLVSCAIHRYRDIKKFDSIFQSNFCASSSASKSQMRTKYKVFESIQTWSADILHFVWLWFKHRSI